MASGIVMGGGTENVGKSKRIKLEGQNFSVLTTFLVLQLFKRNQMEENGGSMKESAIEHLTLCVL